MRLDSLLPARWRRRKGPVIPAVRLSGIITPTSTPLQQTLSLSGVAHALDKAFADKRAPAVALLVNSPGGSPVQSRLIHQRVRALARKHGKPVLVFIEDVGASGGYMIALAGDEIFADETSIVGSIGVVSAGFGFTEAIDRLGIERRVHTSGENKAILDPFRPERAEDVAHLKELQGDIHRVFIAMVRKARGERLASDPNLFTGLFWTGAKARDLGLIDGCGLPGEVIAQRYGADAELRLVVAKRGVFSRAPQGVNLAGAVDPHALAQSVAAALPAGLLAALEARGWWARYGL